MIDRLDTARTSLYGLTNQLAHLFETFHEDRDYEPRFEAVVKHFAKWIADHG